MLHKDEAKIVTRIASDSFGLSFFEFLEDLIRLACYLGPADHKDAAQEGKHPVQLALASMPMAPRRGKYSYLPCSSPTHPPQISPVIT